MRQSPHELLFQEHLKDAGCTEMERQHRFHPTRKWLLDFAHVDTKVGIEIDGGEFMYVAGQIGAHSRGAQMAYDYEKRNEAIMLGWVVVQLTGQMVNRHGREWAKRVKELIDKRACGGTLGDV